MGLPKIDINLQNGNVPSVTPTTDSVMGLIVSGVAVSGKLELNKPYVVYGLAQVEALGIDAEYDKTNKVNAYAHVKEFFAQAGKGAELWLQVVTATTTMEDICDKANSIAKKLLEKANGRIKVLGITRTPDAGYTPTTTDGLDADVFKAVLKADALAKELAGVSLQGSGQTTGEYRPVRIVLEGRSYQGDPSTAKDLTTMSNNRVGVLVGGSFDDGSASVGLLLGRLAKIPVQRNIGRVKDGDIGISDAYLSDGEAIEDKNIGELNTLHDKGYIVLRRHQGKSGFYFSDDPMCVAKSDDYNSLSRARVIDKVINLVHQTYLNELLDEVEFEADGTINPAMAKALEGAIENVVNQQMVANKELSLFKAIIDLKQNVLTTNRLGVQIQVLPVGSMKEIAVDLGFVTKITE